MDYQASINAIQLMRNDDISNRHLKENDLRECELIKNQFCDFLRQIYEAASDVGSNFTDVYLKEQFGYCDYHFNQMKGRVEATSRVVGSSASNDFQNSRRDLTESFRSVSSSAQTQMMPFHTALRNYEFTKTFSSTRLRELTDECESKVKQFEAHVSEASVALDKLRDRLGRQVALESAKNFGKQAEGHKEREKVCLFLTIFFAVSFAIAAFISVATFPSQLTAGMVIPTVVSRILVLSAIGIFFKVSLTKYNLERNLHILYAHRNTVMDLYLIVDASLNPETQREAKDQLRLEISKLLYSDPQTGYVKSFGEINFTPVFNAVEKFAGS